MIKKIAKAKLSTYFDKEVERITEKKKKERSLI